MRSVWAAIEAAPEATAEIGWCHRLGANFQTVASFFLRRTRRIARAVPCPQECGCCHTVSPRGANEFVGLCKCEERDCFDLLLSKTDVEVLELNPRKLGRAIAHAFGCDAKEVDFGLPQTWQIGSFSGAAMPVILIIPGDQQAFRSTVGQVVARLREHFVVLAPTGRFHDAHTHALLKGAKAGFFDLESLVTITPQGNLRAAKSGSELFSPFLAATKEPASDDEARRLFALLKELDSETNVRKAPVSQVFRLYCLEELSRAAVAKRCGCVESLVTLRLKAIHKKLGRHPMELRQLSPQFERIEDSLSDPRAKHIHRKSAIGDGRFDDDD